MKIAFCSSEVFPFAKTGGLADVSGSLPLALAKAGCKVKVFMPFYKNIKPEKINEDFGLIKREGIDFIFIKNENYFFRDGLYGTIKGDYPDNLERFNFFCKKFFEILKKINFIPEIIHTNDWQTSLINVFLKTIYKGDSFFKKTKSILTIHNLAYQGLFEKEKFPFLGLPWDYFTMAYLEFYGKINLLKGGIVFADMVNTVSPNYAKQIQTPDYGCGLDGVLREKRDKLVGILNAIDYEIWDPKKDKLIYFNYSLKDLEKKSENKKRFQKEFGLKLDTKKFLLGMVSRLAEQKGIDLIAESLDYFLNKYQLVILGLGDEKYHQILKKKAQQFKESFSLQLKFDEEIAHKIYASCDAFLMPSRFEPCGLSQMISYKYATVPIVHHTGGLVDTVLDYKEKGGGFVFKNYNKEDFILTIERAYEVFRKKEAWEKLLKKIMKYNFSWEKTALEYINFYKRCQCGQ